MSRVIVIDRIAEGRMAAALLVDGRLEDLLIDPAPGDTSPIPGEIYRAKIDRLLPKLGAAFVKLGRGQTGFLREAKGRKEGEGLLVQVISYPEPGKASPVTTRILYKGRYVIHTPDAPGVNLSRQIKDPAERARLAELLAEVLDRARAEASDASALASSGLIARSAAAGAETDAIASEARDLIAAHLSTGTGSGTGLGLGAAGGLPPSDARSLALRDWTDPAPDRIAADTREGFDDHGVRDRIDRLKSPRVELAADAWMSIEATAALVAIDVNTGGGFQGGDALSANLAAARELPRQLRLRGLGGIVAVDFAPLPKRDRKRIEDALKAAFRKDPIETTLAGWTPLGLFELQRKRERRPLSELL